MSDLRDDIRPVRVGGAIDLDLSKVAEETTRRVLTKLPQVVAELVMPALAQLDKKLEQLLSRSSAPVPHQTAVAALAASLATVRQLDHVADIEWLANHQADRLRAAGITLSVTAAPEPAPRPDTEAYTGPVTEQAEYEEWNRQREARHAEPLPNQILTDLSGDDQYPR